MPPTRTEKLQALQAAINGEVEIVRRYKGRHKPLILVDATVVLPDSRTGTDDKQADDLVTKIIVSFPHLCQPLQIVNHPDMSRSDFEALMVKLLKTYDMFTTIHQRADM